MTITTNLLTNVNVQYSCTLSLSGQEIFMRNIIYSAARATLASVMDQTIQDCTPILITRQNGEDCVLMSSKEYSSLMETAYLMRSPSNAEHLLKSLAQASAKALEKKVLDE